MARSTPSPTQQAPALPRPTLRSAAPFLGVAVVGLGSALLPPYDAVGGEIWLMLGTFAVAVGFLVVSTRRSTRTWVDPVPAFLFFVVLGFARDATGGGASGLIPLAALPLLWLAMTGTRRDVSIAAVLLAGIFLVPAVLVGAPEYPASNWRSAVLWVSFAALVVPVFQRMVAQLALETRKGQEANAEMDGIMRGAMLSSMIATEVDGTIRSFSLGAEELLGYRAADVVGRCTPGQFHDVEEVTTVALELGVEPGFAVFQELARRSAPSRAWTYVRADGERLYVRLAVTELKDADGLVTGYLGVAIDTTEAVRTRKALELAEAQWRVLLEHLPDLTLIMVDQEARIQVVAGAGAMGQGLRGAEGELLSKYSKDDNMAILARLIGDAVEGHEGTAELVGTANGAEHEIVVTPLPAGPTGPRALVLARNVSALRERERAVIGAKERAERLFADAPHGVAVLSEDGLVLQVNSALTTLTGRDAESLQGSPLADLSLPEDDQIERHLATALADRGALVETEWNLLGAHGDEVHVVLSSRVLSGDDGMPDIVLVNVVDLSERRRYEQRLAHLADHDVLTGLANRRRFDDELTRHLERCQRYGARGALLLLDLDNFKEVNDTLGHGVGDQLIISTAALLQSGVRSTDLVARLGGDEFAILLPEADQKAAEVVAGSIVDRVREHTSTLDGTRRRVTASVGVVTLQAASEHAADVLALADMTMYDAKDAGRDGYVVLAEDAASQPRTGARLAWKARIEKALENDRFALHLQPLLDLDRGAITSAEVLLRLDDADDLVPPGRFLYIAERAGLMPQVDAWVIRHSMPMLAQLRQIDPEFRLEVNLSGLSIGNPDIERVIIDSLHEHQVDPSALILEITETAAVADVEMARAFAERMTTLGCQFALDDFGAGFGSFYYLKHLLFDYVKIDGEFVANCHRSSIDRTILRSIVGIAHDLGKRTVAEFVAEPSTLAVVRAEGVDLAQGYLVGEPVAMDEFVARFLSGQDLPPGLLLPAVEAVR